MGEVEIIFIGPVQGSEGVIAVGVESCGENEQLGIELAEGGFEVFLENVAKCLAARAGREREVAGVAFAGALADLVSEAGAGVLGAGVLVG